MISQSSIKTQIKYAKELCSKANYTGAIELLYPLINYAKNIGKDESYQLYKSIGYNYYKLKDFNNAIWAYEQALQFYSNDSYVYNVLGFMYFYIDNDKSIEYYLKGMELAPDLKNFVMLTQVMIKSKKYDLKDLKNVFEKYVDTFRPTILKGAAPFKYNPKDFDENKRLKIGYMSSDFHCHAMMTFSLPIIEHHSKDFDIVFYHCGKKTDYVTERIKGLGYPFIDCSGMSHKELAEKIHSDGVDILVDLSGYTHDAIWALLFKPAPIICQYLGFLGTYGMKEVDYILADEYTIPKNLAKYYTEKPMYIECGMNRFDFNSKKQNLPDITPLPYLNNGYITFGSFNGTSKLNTFSIKLWANVLKAVPNSKLLIYRTQMLQRDIDRISKLLKSYEIDMDRVIFDSTLTEGSHFKCYDFCDIALDPSPFSGLTITIEQAFMGVPTITLDYLTISAKGSGRINHMLGQDNLTAKTESEYIKIAQDLAQDIEKLKWYRENYRQVISTSKLCTDYDTYVSDIESAYRKAWQDFCRS